MPSNSKKNSSKTFPIVVSLAVVAMIGVVIFSVTSTNKVVKAESKQEFSPSVAVSPVTIDGKIGESKLSSYNEGAQDDAVGKLVPKISAQDFKGNNVEVVPGEKPYVITVLAHWCPHCQVEVPKIVELKKNGGLPDDIEFYAVASGTSDQRPNYPPSQWLFEEDWPFSKMADDKNGSIASALGLTGYPYLIFVNADGTVAQRLSGEKDASVIAAAAQAISQEKKK
ncbi:MAG TPA: TlpA disulfide reductase family protein [Acidimicrobiia bacterium]|nr:TlpA disulfide reductase family protein [Acidimicrobiia bacterium]